MKKQVYNNEELIKLFLDQDYSNGPIEGRTPNKKYYVDNDTLYHAPDDFMICQFTSDGRLGIGVHPTDGPASAFTALVSLFVARRTMPIFPLNQ